MTESVKNTEMVVSSPYEGYGMAMPIEPAAPNPLLVVARVLRGRYHWAVLLGVLLGVPGAIGGYAALAPVYKSVGAIIVEPKQETIVFQTEDKALANYDAQVQSQAIRIASRRFVDLAMQDPEWLALGRAADPEAVADFEKRLEVKHPNHTLLVQVAYSDPDSRAAMVSVNSILRAYMDAVKAEKDLSSKGDKLAKNLTRLTGEVGEKQREVRTITGSAGVPALQSEYQFAIEQKGTRAADVAALDLEILVLESTREAAPVPLAQLTEQQVALKDGVVEQLLVAKAQAQARVGLLIENGVGPGNPEMADAQAALQVISERLRDRVQAVRGSLALSPDDRVAKLEELRTRREQMQERYLRADEQVRAAGAKLDRIADLQTDLEQIQRHVESVRNRQEELQTEREADSPIRVMTWGEQPVSPDKDRRIPLGAAGGLGGFVLGVGIVFLLGLRDNRMRHVEDVNVEPGRGRFLGILPEITPGSNAHRNRELVAASEYAVHHVRTLLQLRSPDPHRIVALTSASPGAGKTTVGIALGLSFGATSARTLLVDCDLVGHGLTSAVSAVVCEGAAAVLDACDAFTTLDEAAAEVDRATHIARVLANRDVAVSDDRIESLLARVRDAAGGGSSRARAASRALEGLARYRGVNGFAPGARAGVMDVLEGAPLDDCVLESGFPNLSILPVGRATAADAERLSPTQLARLAATCREQYDTIIVDTGPVLGSLEAAFVSSMADEVVFVVSRGQPRKLADQAMERLESLGAEVSGIVFNRAPLAEVERSAYSSVSGRAEAGRA